MSNKKKYTPVFLQYAQTNWWDEVVKEVWYWESMSRSICVNAASLRNQKRLCHILNAMIYNVFQCKNIILVSGQINILAQSIDDWLFFRVSVSKKNRQYTYCLLGEIDLPTNFGHNLNSGRVCYKRKLFWGQCLIDSRHS